MFRIINLRISTSQFLIAVLVGIHMVASETKHSIIGQVGKRVQLDCVIAHNKENLDVMWKDLVYNEARDPKVIYENNLVSTDHPRRGVYKLTEKKDLIISNVTNEDAGEYFCQVGDQTYKYMLDVVGEPVCKGPPTLIVDEEGEVSCEIAISGSELPKLEMSVMGEKLKTTDMSDIGKVKATVKVTGSPSKDQAVYKCAISMPGLMEECSIKMNVPYAVQNVTITPKKSSYEAGEKINCTAKGNPAPQIEWEPMSEDGMGGQGWRYMVVSKDWIGEDKEFTCIASNSVSGKDERASAKHMFMTEEAKMVEPEPETGKTGGETVISTINPKPSHGETPKESQTGEDKQMIGIIIGIIVVALALVIIIVAVVLFKRRKAAAKKPKGAKPVPTKEPNDIKDGKV